jgi:hypothetical protein
MHHHVKSLYITSHDCRPSSETTTCYGMVKARCHQAAYNMYHGQTYNSSHQQLHCSSKQFDAGAISHDASTALISTNFDGSLQGEL